MGCGLFGGSIVNLVIEFGLKILIEIKCFFKYYCSVFFLDKCMNYIFLILVLEWGFYFERIWG